MVNIILVGHGDLARSLLRTAEMIAGPQQRVFTIQIAAEESPESFSEALREVVRSAEPEPSIILVDLLGGTPYNVAARHLARGHVECVTGMNLPMLLELIMTRDQLTVSELAASVAQAGRDSVKDLGPLLIA